MRTPEELDEAVSEKDRKVEEHDGLTFGQRVRILENDEDEGLFEGAEGHLILERVGAAKYGNERVGVFFFEDGYNEPSGEIHDIAIVDFI